MKREVRLGLLVVIFLVGVIFFAVWLKGNPFEKKKNLQVFFASVHGLSIGSPVEYAGLQCGRVTGFDVNSKGVVAKIQIFRPEVKIREGDRFTMIPSSTIASEYQIYIIPNTQPSPEVPDAATIIGQPTPGLQDFLFSAQDALNDLLVVMKQVQSILGKVDQSSDAVSPLFSELGDIASSGRLERLAQNLEQSSQSIRKLTGDSQDLISGHKAEINTTIHNLASASQKANQTLSSIQGGDINSTISDLKETANNLKQITGAVDPVDIKKGLSTLTGAAEQAQGIMFKLQNDDPSQDAATLIKDNLQRIDRISNGLEYNLQHKSLFRVLFSRVPLSSSNISSTNKSASDSSYGSSNYKIFDDSPSYPPVPNAPSAYKSKSKNRSPEEIGNTSTKTNSLSDTEL
ncbi:MAG: MlaD family protein [Candidatus Caenarcaniphilales bacterium]|nr:MlaD family protein [Candidatus Caenarcaniphilales bacterium]